MKSVFLALLLVGVAFGAVLVNNQYRAEGPPCPLADPLIIDAGPINLTIGNAAEELILDIAVGSLTNGGVATGLGPLSYTYTFDVLALTLVFEILVPGTACAQGDHYEAQGTADFSPYTPDTLPTGPFTGNGAYDACVSDAVIAASAAINIDLITSRVSVSELIFSRITFAGVAVNLEGLTVAGELVDWVDFNENFKTRFDAQFDNNGVLFTERLRTVVNNRLDDLTLQDIIDIIDGGEGGGTPAPCLQH